jgi:violaxanthin de-epoxidase
LRACAPLPRARAGQFYERSDLQRFVQDPGNPAQLLNHDNTMLHYEDDWYVAAFKPDAYALIYYRGRNDAWDGYGGAVLYTRAPTVDAAFVPELSAAAERLGLRWSDFVETDNTCGPAPPLAVTTPADLDTLVDDVRALEAAAVGEAEVLEADVENDLVSFSRGFTLLKGRAAATEKAAEQFLSQEQRALQAEIKREAAALERMEAAAAAGDAGGPLQALLKLLGLGGKQ